MKVLPLFKSEYSLGRSILTLKAKGSSIDSGPDSIVDLAAKSKFDKVFLVDDSISGFLEAYRNLSAEKIKLVFGLRVTACPDMLEKGEEALKKSSKVVVLAKNEEGYRSLIKISTDSSRLGFYYEPRIDYNTLKKYWNNNLTLAVPFYDSFIFKNLLTESVCMPDFDFTDPVFFQEESDLPFDHILSEKVKEYCSKNSYDIIPSRSIYYNKKKDFKAYLTFRCVNKRSTLDKPEIEHMASNDFCLERWVEQND